MALTPDESSILQRLREDLESTRMQDQLMLRYYQGSQRIEQLGMAIPPKMRRFLVFANWCRVYVDTIEARQKLRSLMLPGEETADPELQAIADETQLSVRLKMFNRDRLIFGRGILSVGANEADATRPLVRAESPLEMAVELDQRRESVVAAARFYGTDRDGRTPTNATLYLPKVTIWLEDRGGQWVETDRDQHNLGRVPVIVHLNRRLSGSLVGESQMTDLIPFVDSTARSLTNLQFAQEAHGIPRMFMTGVSQGDFVDKDGKPVPKFEAYFNAIHTLTKSDSKIGQLTAADLKNFETAVNIYGRQASTITGFPTRYFGITQAQPPTEGTIRADETQLVESVESQNEEVGATVGDTMALAWRFSTGKWPTGRIQTDWFDPATPTMAQREDALSKRRAQGVLSREGYWDELGWSEARKARERAYLADEDADPVVSKLLRGVTADAALGA